MKLGDGVVPLSAPMDLIAGPWSLAGAAQRSGAGASSGPDALASARDGLAGAGLAEAIRGRRVGLLIADGTRAWDPESVLAPLRDLLQLAERIEVFLCTGTHDPETPENRRLTERVRSSLARFDAPVRVVVHDARGDTHAELGTTSRGTRIRVLDAAHACESFLVVADMKHHYFAGYSNPVKYYVPGVCAVETARDNHSLALEENAVFGRHPWHPDPSRRTNPLAEDNGNYIPLATKCWEAP